LHHAKNTLEWQSSNAVCIYITFRSVEEHLHALALSTISVLNRQKNSHIHYSVFPAWSGPSADVKYFCSLYHATIKIKKCLANKSNVT